MDTENLGDFFDSTAPAPPATETAEPAAAKKETKRRGPKPGSKRKTRTKPVEAATVTAPAQPVKKRGRKPRADKQAIEGRPHAVKIELVTAVTALSGLLAADAAIVLKLVSGLQKLPKASRRRIVEALGRIFA